MAAFAMTACNDTLPRVPTPTIAATAERPLYRLEIGDVIDVRFPINPELNEQAVVGPDGRVSIQFAHNVPAAGRTFDEITHDLSQAYSTELVNPQVSLSLRAYSGTRVYVAGEVIAPGEFVETGPITALQAIARAGGFKTSAQTRQVILFRKSESGKPDAYSIDVSRLDHGSSEANDIELTTYDIVYVPRSVLGNLTYAFDQIRGLIPFTFAAIYTVP
jgi:polysaccharide export outer membrane protein